VAIFPSRVVGEYDRIVSYLDGIEPRSFVFGFTHDVPLVDWKLMAGDIILWGWSVNPSSKHT
jgi:hypothetical protein